MTANQHTKLDTLASTAICGNDILSSSLYVSGIAAIYAGVYAPLVLLLVALVLFFYKAVYKEVVGALPINGGAYNCLLNATSKSFASLAGVMTILSYIATAVISAKVAAEYLHFGFEAIPVLPVTLAILFVFAFLVIVGVKDSARVAVTIFIFHLCILSLFVGLGLFHVLSGHSLFALNMQSTTQNLLQQQGLLKALFFAFAASLLGISGFESSANFVEEQKPGVFPKTLGNMLAGVTVFNPLIAFVIVSSLSLGAISLAKDFVLADAARTIAGTYFGYVVIADAFLVLSGAVLTSYVGVSGLVYRMTLDAVLPQFLLAKKKHSTQPKIIITFFLLCSSILVLTGGELLSLAGVYTISFLGVMSLFAWGNLTLRETRSDLKRPYNAPFLFVVFAFLATAAGIVGNILINPQNLVFFGLYFVPAILIVLAVINQAAVLRLLLKITPLLPKLNTAIKNTFEDILDGHFVVFIHHTNRVYNALSYIDRNENGRKITLVHCDNKENYEHEHKHDYDESYQKLKSLLPPLKDAGVFPYFAINLIYKHKPFSPALIDEVAKELRVHKNRIFIGSIHHMHDFDYADLGGVRIISE